MPSERIQLLIDVVSGNSRSTLGRLKSDLKAADGAFAKTKTAASAMGGFLANNVPLAAAGAATAVVGFATDAAGAFTDLGVEVGNFRDATGFTAEASSKLIEVVDKLGVPAEGLASTINRMNRAAANTPELFENIGASIVRAKDGTVDAEQTFLNTVEAINSITDPTEKAAAASKIFGRNWQSMAELVAMGADGITEAMQQVSDQQIISDEEIAKARKMRDRLDDLQDSFLAFQLGAGEFTVDFVSGLGKISDGIGEVFQQAQRLATLQDLRQSIFGGGGGDKVGTVAADLGRVKNAVEELGPPAAYAAGEVEKIGIAHQKLGRDVDYAGGRLIWETDQLGDAGEAASDFEGRVQGVADEEKYLADQADLAAEAIRNLREEVVQGLDSTFDYEKATLDLGESIREITTRTDEYNQMLADNSDDIDDNNHSAEEMADALTGVREAQIGAAEQALETATAFAGQNGAQEGSRQHTRRLKEELQRLADANPAIRGEVQKYIDKLNEIPPDKPTRAELRAQEAEAAALEYRNKLNEIKTQIRTGVHLDTTSATSAANAFEQRLNQIQDETVVINTVVGPGSHRQHGGTIPGGGEMALVGEAGPELVALPGGSRVFPTGESARMLGIQSFQRGGTVRATSRVRKTLERAETAATAANALEAQIKALRELADATEDADEKEKILEKQSKLLEEREGLLTRATNLAESAADRHAKSINREQKELEGEVDTLRKHAEALRNQADAAREAATVRAEGLGEQAASLREAYNAEQALDDARQQAAHTQDAVADADERLAAARKAAAEANKKQTADGITTYVHSVEERTAAEKELADAQQARSAANRDALRAEEDAAVAVADAQVELARQRAEARGEEFTELDAIAAMRKSLLAQGRGDLVRDLGLDRAAQLARQAIAVQVAADRRADKLEKAAAKDEKNANTMEKAANALDRFANKLPDAIARAFARSNRQNLTEAELTRLIRNILAGP